jgi:hypothetical protein
MAVNVSKTKFMIFKPTGTKIVNLFNTSIIFDDNEEGSMDPANIFNIDRIHDKHDIKDERTFKFLGLYLDENLSFNEHCKRVSSKISSAIYIINRVKNFLPSEVLRTLYFSLVHPHLLYCLPIYACTTEKNIGSLFKLQKKAVRIVAKASYLDHTAPLFDSLNIMPLEKLITFNQSLLMHSIVHRYAPMSLLNIWNFDRAHERNLRNNDELPIPFARTEQTKRLPYFSFPKIWNNLHDQKWTQNPITFKISMKQLLTNNET